MAETSLPERRSALHLLDLDMSQCTPEELSDYRGQLLDEKAFQVDLDYRTEPTLVAERIQGKIDEINERLKTLEQEKK